MVNCWMIVRQIFRAREFVWQDLPSNNSVAVMRRRWSLVHLTAAEYIYPMGVSLK